jgi:hypothetical protein
MASDDSETGPPTLLALYTGPEPEMPIVPARRWRDWMEATAFRVANRCLPLLMANQSGWALLNPHPFTATWSGDENPSGVTIEFDQKPPPARAFVTSHFGYGIVTWQVPYLFRTPPGWNLLARGPANDPRDGIGPLEGLIETDWSVAQFTMNWKITRTDHPVRFEAGDPFCVVVPQPRGALEAFEPKIGDIGSSDAAEGHQIALRRRDQFQMARFVAEFAPNAEVDPREWEQDYFRGRLPDGSTVQEHQTKLVLRRFPDFDADGRRRAAD